MSLGDEFQQFAGDTVGVEPVRLEQFGMRAVGVDEFILQRKRPQRTTSASIKSNRLHARAESTVRRVLLDHAHDRKAREGLCDAFFVQRLEAVNGNNGDRRSEEHTSELQSLR